MYMSAEVTHSSIAAVPSVGELNSTEALVTHDLGFTAFFMILSLTQVMKRRIEIRQRKALANGLGFGREGERRNLLSHVRSASVN